MRPKAVAQLPMSRTKADQRISSHEFSATALRHAASVEPIVREYRGTTRLAPSWPGLLTAQLHGGRVIR